VYKYIYIYIYQYTHLYIQICHWKKETKKNKTLDKDCNTTQLAGKLTYLKSEKLHVIIMDTIVYLLR